MALANVVPLHPRAARLASGDLIDLTRRAASLGYAVPVAITPAAFRVVAPDLTDVLWLGFLAAARLGADGQPAVAFDTARARLVLRIEPGDQHETTLTLDLSQETR